MSRLGFEGVSLFVDFWVWGDRLGDGREVGAALMQADLGLASLVTSVHGDLDRYGELADVLARLGCGHLVVIGGTGRGAKERAALAHQLNALGRVVRTRGVRASYHHHTDTTGESFNDVRELIRLTDPEAVGLTFDAGHATKDFVDLPLARRAVGALAALWDRVALVELKDWLPASDLDTPVGEGWSNAAELVRALVSRSYSDWVVVEQNDDLGRSSQDKLECAARSLRYIRAHESAEADRANPPTSSASLT
jgi:sugar phosphate isomerase/epimerase